MIYCENCGKQLENNAAFCAECGHKVGALSPGKPSEGASGKQPVAGMHSAGNAAGTSAKATANTKSASNAASATAPKALSPKNKKTAIIAGACAAAIVVIAIVAFAVMGANPISNDRLRDDVNASNFATTGVVPSNYVNESPYEITDFKVDDQQKSKQNLFGAELECVTATFTGTMSNANFETDFTGEVSYMKENGEWVLFSDPSITSSTTTPLKGVDFIDENTESSDSAVVYSTSDFASTLDGGEGSYTSTATQKVSYDMWFATDTATSTATFAFSETDGWQMQGEAQLSGQATEWKLAGKTFELTDESNYGKVTASLSFSNATSETLDADYVIDYDNKREDKTYYKYHNVDLTGAVTNEPTHEFGQPNFAVSFKDTNNSVAFDCRSNTVSDSNGSAVSYALNTSVETESSYMTSYLVSMDSGNDSYLSFGGNFIEKA
ncbi:MULTISPECIES: zinc ribbon domain-containing protein [unclassified Adlercreutzia]|uniref:zinc ribbon domain-containing protein n=1 Tax=unclassified Adlercreutzia TaxID=2636013 RepID=UPI0013ECC9E8|nr:MULTISPECIES: zinc ribbon domain-containing protein [unclassified Adlercreutzia]